MSLLTRNQKRGHTAPTATPTIKPQTPKLETVAAAVEEDANGLGAFSEDPEPEVDVQPAIDPAPAAVKGLAAMMQGIELLQARGVPNPIDRATEVAREAVEKVLSEQADAARYDVIDGRVTLTLNDEDIGAYRFEWELQNSNADANSKLTFSQYLTHRLRACRAHTATRPIYVYDHRRQQMELLFRETITDDLDLVNKLDRYIRPIIESTDGQPLQLRPVDPVLMEMVTGWEPDKTPAEALGDFMHEAAMQKAGLE